MLNSTPPEQIPLFLPVSVTVLLKTWFNNAVIDEAVELLRKGELSQFFIHRNGAGALLGDSQLTIIFEQTDRIAQGFTLKEEYCGLCGFRKKKRRCAHLAALCILSLQEKEDSSYFPLPLFFKDSVWARTADMLYGWLNREGEKIRFTYEKQVTSLAKKTKDGSIKAIFTNTTTSSIALLNEENNDRVHTLFEKIAKSCTTKNEQLLLAAGAVSKALQRDRSIWTKLCALAYCCVGDAPPVINYSSVEGCFRFEAGNPQFGLQIVATLPRPQTFEILKRYGKLDGQFRLLPAGQPGSKVSLDAKGRIVVSPLVWLDDSRIMRLSDLGKHKFGNHYYLANEGFFQIGPDNSDAKIQTGPASQQGPSLFDFLRRDDETIVEHNDIADFLTRNEQQLRHPDNQVDAAVTAIRFINIPDKLIIYRQQEEEGWIVLACQFGIGEAVVTHTQLRKKLKKRQALTAGNTTLELHEGPLAWLHKMLTRSKSDNITNDSIRLTRGEFASLIAAVPQIEHRHSDNRLQQTIDRLTTAPDNQPCCDNAIRYRHHLRDYQKVGVSWLFTLHELGLGGILADDMGLGKTHQALALLDTIIHETASTAPILVICPASVLLHWEDKLKRFYPELSYAIYYGPDRNLGKALQRRIVITTYAIARGDSELLAQYTFDLIVFDEIQALKNRNTVTHQACKGLRSRVAIGLSGTPIENSLEDLYSIFAICLPGFFGPFSSFEDIYLTPIEKHRSSPQERRLIQRISPFVLRRSRAQVLVELPALIEDDRSCELSEDQLALYRETISSRRPLLADLADEGVRIDYLHVFAMLTRLKQICDHPCLVENCTDPNRYRSGKWDLFVELLHECLDSGRKVVVFSQYLGMLDLIAHHLTEMNIGFAFLRGRMSAPKRQQMIDTFETDDDCRVFTASLLAGGTGIDLISGNAVIHYDRWWNPAKEDQATARVHRMGQKDVVHLFRLSTKNTLEEKINAIISEKKQLSEAIIQESELGMLQQLSREELLQLFSI